MYSVATVDLVMDYQKSCALLELYCCLVVYVRLHSCSMYVVPKIPLYCLLAGTAMKTRVIQGLTKINKM